CPDANRIRTDKSVAGSQPMYLGEGPAFADLFEV
ncbi:MAG: hypothetical protein ACI9P7_000520, partial [Candidatus Azotimanducaceae bacterium]